MLSPIKGFIYFILSCLFLLIQSLITRKEENDKDQSITK